MPSKDVMERLLAAKQAAAAVSREFTEERARGELTRQRCEELVRRFVAAKFRLGEDEARAAGDRLEALAQASLAKMLRIAPELVGREDRAANCDGADSATVKQALVIMALRREFGIEIDCFKAGLAPTTGALAGLVWEAVQRSGISGQTS